MRPDPFSNMTLVDLSLDIFDDAPIWSAEPRCMVHDWIVKGRTHGSREPTNMKYLCLSGHQGTHTDAPVHLSDGGRTLSEIPLARYLGWCRVLDFTDKKLGDHVTASDLEARGVRDGERILLHTGWDRYLQPFDETYFNLDHPHFSADGIRWAVDHGIELIGMDTPSMDPSLVDHPGIFRDRDRFPIVIELMTNLDKIVGREVYLVSFPIKIRSGDGAWMRSVAFVPKG